MKTSVERVDETTVKLTVTVEAPRVDAAVDAAATQMASQVRIPGFRPGRVPRRVLESRVGKQTLAAEALRDALPAFYEEAVTAEQLEVVGQPELDVDTFESGRDAAFTATVEVRPEIEVPELEGVEVAHPEWEVTDEELGAQLDALRERFAEVQPVEREVRTGDLVTISVGGSVDGEPLEALSAEDIQHEVKDPSGDGGALDRALLGAEAGAVVTFTETQDETAPGGAAGRSVDFRVIVKQVQTKELPDLDDDFALTASEFDTFEELRDDLRSTLGRNKLLYARQALRGEVVRAVAEPVEVPLPKSMVEAEQQWRLQRMAAEAQSYGLEPDQYFAAIGAGSEEFTERMRADAEETVRAQLVVDAIGKAQGIELSNEDLGEEIARQAARTGREPQEVAQIMLQPDRVGLLVADALRRKTIDRILELVTVTGAPSPEATEEAAAELAAEQREAADEDAAAVDDEDGDTVVVEVEESASVGDEPASG